MSDEWNPECEAFAAVVNAVLDGDAPAGELASAHALACRECRELASASRLLASAGPELQSLPPVPADLTPKLVAAMRRHRRRWVPALAAGLALAGGVWLVVGRAESSKPDIANVETKSGLEDSTRPTKPARVSDQLAAVTSVARSASEKATASTRLLTDFPLNPTPPTLQREWNESALAPLEKASRTTAEPVAGTARRAVGLFLRDFGLTPKPAG